VLKLTKKADYALIAVGHLAGLGPAGGANVSAKDIADEYRLPQEALAKILQKLAKAKLLVAHYGTNGGYALARDARQISALEVIRAIDGPLFITSCLPEHDGGCEQSGRCTVREPLRQVNDSIRTLLENIKISDMRRTYETHATSQTPSRAEELVTLR
jgi:Rrf2 family protein